MKVLLEHITKEDVANVCTEEMTVSENDDVVYFTYLSYNGYCSQISAS